VGRPHSSFPFAVSCDELDGRKRPPSATCEMQRKGLNRAMAGVDQPNDTSWCSVCNCLGWLFCPMTVCRSDMGINCIAL
jgi:hypothetical protein